MYEENKNLSVLKWLAQYFHKHGKREKAREIYQIINSNDLSRNCSRSNGNTSDRRNEVER